MSFEIIPSVDLRGGRVVRLMQGDYERRTTYAVDARALAASYAQAGARWLHVVDLDGARVGRFGNLGTIEALAGEGMQVQAGGGVRERSDLQSLFDAGVARVVIGSVAVREPERVAGWLDTFGADRIVIALDTRRTGECWALPVSGWTEASARTLDELAPWYAARGARHLLCTDIARDGMLAGCNTGLYRQLAKIAPQLAVQASGGVRSFGDVCAVRAAGASGVIIGRALLDGRLTIADMLTATGVASC